MLMTSEMAEFLRKMPVREKMPKPESNSDFYKSYMVLVENRLVKENVLGECQITPAGISALTQYDRAQDEVRQKAAAQAAEEERRVHEQRKSRAHDWRVAIFGAIIAGLVILTITILIGR
jgi:hypothetical protein